MADKIVRIVADTTKYQKGINDAKKSLNGFNSAGGAGTKVLQNMLGAFKGLLPTLSLATTGVAALKAGIYATQTTADGFAITMATLKGVTDNFFTALNQGSLGSFISNLQSAASAAREAAQWLDQLGNTQMSYNYATADVRADIQEQRAIIDRNSGSTEEERKAAKEELVRLTKEWQDNLSTLREVTYKTIKSDISSTVYGMIGTDIVDEKTISEVLKIDTQMNYSEQRSEQSKLFEDYMAQRKEIETRMSELREKAYKVNSQGLKVFVGNTEEEKIQLTELDVQMSELTEKYKKPIVFNALLEVKTDDELKAVYDQMVSISAEEKVFGKTIKSINADFKALENDVNKATASVSGFNAAMANTELTSMKVTAQGLRATVDKSLSGFGPVEETPKQTVTYAMSYVPEAVKAGTGYSSVMDSLNGLTGQLNTKQLADYNEQLLKIGQRREMIDSLAGSFAALGMAIQGTGSDALAAAGAIVQMVAQIVPAMTTLFASSSAAGTAEAVAETPTLAGKIAAIATVTASIIGMVSTFKNIQFAEGGIVPGADFTDGITARVSSGEMVLNAHDQRNLYESIKSGSIGGGGGRSYITGEQLVTVINNYGRRTGRGEILR